MSQNGASTLNMGNLLEKATTNGGRIAFSTFLSMFHEEIEKVENERSNICKLKISQNNENIYFTGVVSTPWWGFSLKPMIRKEVKYLVAGKEVGVSNTPTFIVIKVPDPNTLYTNPPSSVEGNPRIILTETTTQQNGTPTTNINITLPSISDPKDSSQNIQLDKKDFSHITLNVDEMTFFLQNPPYFPQTSQTTPPPSWNWF